MIPDRGRTSSKILEGVQTPKNSRNPKKFSAAPSVPRETPYFKPFPPIIGGSGPPGPPHMSVPVSDWFDYLFVFASIIVNDRLLSSFTRKGGHFWFVVEVL